MIVTVVEKPLHLAHQQVRVVLQGLQPGRDVQVFWTSSKEEGCQVWILLLLERQGVQEVPCFLNHCFSHQTIHKISEILSIFLHMYD